MTPALVTIFLSQFVAIRTNFFLPLVMLQDERLYPVRPRLFSWNGRAQSAPELQMLVIIGSLVSVVPLILAFLMLQRCWRSGLSAGGVK